MTQDYKTDDEIEKEVIRDLKNFKIKRVIMKTAKIWGIIALALVILGFVFYWWQIRPIKIRRICIEQNWSKDLWRYDNCLHWWGLR